MSEVLRYIILCFTFTISACIVDDIEESWNFTQWWNQRSELPQLLSEPVVFEEPTKVLHIYSDLDKFDQVHYGGGGDRNDSMESVIVTSSPIHFDKSGRPQTTSAKLNQTIHEFFTKSRNWNDDKQYMRDLREAIKDRFLSYGLKTAFHIFKAEDNPLKLVSKIFENFNLIFCTFIFYY
jgi:hypothetical protein